VASGCDDLLWIVEHREEHSTDGRMHSHILHWAVTSYEKDDGEPIRIDVLDPHGRRQRGTQLIHKALLLLDWFASLLLKAKLKLNGSTVGVTPPGLATVILSPASVNLRWASQILPTKTPSDEVWRFSSSTHLHPRRPSLRTP